jgi:hypothetical protein
MPVPGFAMAGAAATAAVIVVATVGPPIAGSAPVSIRGLPGATQPAYLARLDMAPASPAHPYRVWILGDSVMFDSSLGLQAGLEATGDMSVVVNSSYPGWGLTLDHSWPEDAKQIISTYHPQIVMGTWSWDNQVAADHPQAYLLRLQAAIRMLLAPGNGVQAVVLFEFPEAGPASATTDPAIRAAAWQHQTLQQHLWNDLARQATAAFPGRALYVTTSQAFAPGGRFYTWLPTATGKWIRARKVDNLHMCPYGAAVFGSLVTAELIAQLRLAPMKPGWSTAAWTHSSRYDDPAGACPADGPPAGYHGIPVPPSSSRG